MKENIPHRVALRKGRFSEPGNVYFVTKCAFDTQTNLLAQEENADIVIQSLIWLLKNHLARLCGFVVMPNHYHVVLGLGTKKNLSETMESIGKLTSRLINRRIGSAGSFWEEGFYDRGIRNRADFDSIITYIHYNPVRKCLAVESELRSYSTASPL